MMKINRLYSYPGMILYYFFLISGCFLLFLHDKGEWVIWLNQHSTSLLDLLFMNWTYLGDGILFGLLVVFFIFRSYFFLLLTIISVIIQTLFVQGLKRYVFSDLVRPKLFFENFMDFHQIEGIDIHAHHAFPSGHTATAFSIALILSIYVKNKKWSLVFILAAALVGISRIYLLQHFFIDVYFGSLFGIISVLLSIYLLMTHKSFYHNLADRSILSRR